MFMTINYIVVSCMIVTFLNMIYLMIVNKFVNSRNKFSTFECGMDLMTSLRLPFSLHFYFVSIIFLVFDVELMMILPFVFCFKLFNMMSMFMMIYVLMLFIILSFFYEWWTGLFEWMM
uniref:NADH-ubiquinone oxidoreductase chain 3 n=3 Tax=Bemisia TaxID=7037 RepID=A0A173GHU0_BEMTA|nr:NADH dehydrogenase subunit 3 [Bemisia argentifolii]ALR69391.1 NADH dehydrogenase subunit 3 [Bemisia tabaci]ANH54416.1 NADH dehydrogenase subunit 3 [Bemisia tabaci]ATJ03318.1 NADH dehydrogenase subunit 3 [Bemisia tabaci]ATJ03331.1 NADH dehydrogenase subunit 3 [Bemisia tabaci]